MHHEKHAHHDHHHPHHDHFRHLSYLDKHEEHLARDAMHKIEHAHSAHAAEKALHSLVHELRKHPDELKDVLGATINGAPSVGHGLEDKKYDKYLPSLNITGLEHEFGVKEKHQG